MSFILNYTFQKGAVSNPDGTAAAKVTNCTPVEGPGPTGLGNYPAALDFASGGRVEAELPTLPEAPKFCFRMLLRSGAVADKQIALLCAGLPVRISVEKAAKAAEVNLSVSVKHAESGWGGVTKSLQKDAWIWVDLAFDMDTLAVFIDEKLIGITAFSSISLAMAGDRQLVIGGDAKREAFSGRVAALQIIDGIPAHLENALDAQRGTPEWHISMKAAQLGASFDLGLPSGAPKSVQNETHFIQSYERGAIFFDPADGRSAGIHGTIYAYWKSKPALQAKLGNLLYDEMPAGKAGTRQSVFSNGAILWSAATGCVPIVGQKVFSDYVKMGGVAGPIGLPVSAAVEVPGAYRQEFQGGVLYFDIQANSAAALRGTIAAEYKKQGGHAKLGLPVISDTPVVKKSGNTDVTIGSVAEFGNGAAIYQKKDATKAILLDAEFRQAYDGAGGPTGILGFPTSAITLVGAIRHAGFEAGAIVKIGAKMIVVPAFRLMVKRVETSESEGVSALQDQNDLYMYCTAKENGQEVYKKRYPESGDVSRNVVEPDFKTRVFNPANPNLKVALKLDVWESDWGNDDHLGIFEKELSIADAWGLLDSATGVFNSGKISKIINVLWAVQPDEDNARIPLQDFWNTRNPASPLVSKSAYAAAFYDVDSETEWYSIPDGLRNLYYKYVIKDCAAEGNCSGLCTEAAQAWKGVSIFGRPLSRFSDFKQIESEINIKHCYQYGAETLGWFLGQLLTYNARNPKNVFRESRRFHSVGQQPVLCIFSDWKFSKGHCIIPISWDDSDPKLWTITVFDPNKNNQVQTGKIDPVNNSFEYKPGSTLYKGGLTDLKGGYLSYRPYSIFDSMQVTPVGGLLQLGMSLFHSEAAVLTSILSDPGQELLAGVTPESMSKDLDQKFIPVPALDGTRAGGFLIRPQSASGPMPAGFTQHLKGIKQGELSSGFHWKRQALQLTSSIEKNEKNTLAFSKLSTPRQMVALTAPSDKLMSLSSEQMLGAGNDFISVNIGKIPVKSGVAAQINIQPGLNSIDILSSAERVPAQITLSGKIGGRAFLQQYEAPIEGGTRLVFSHARSSNLLKMGKISQLFGEMRAPEFVRKK